MRSSRPHNPVTGTIYAEGNREILELEQEIQGYETPCWYTYLNARDIGRPVRKGETATRIRGRFGRPIPVFNADQLELGSVEPVILEMDDRNNLGSDGCVEWSIHQQLEELHLELLRIRQRLEPYRLTAGTTRTADPARIAK